MTDRDALLRAVCDSPADDAPRLVYADWLDEHGDPRQAEFIRLQIALPHVTGWDLGRHPEAARIRELWRELRKWRYLTGDWRTFNLHAFVRGFHTFWRGPVAAFLRVAPTPWRLGPVTELTLDFDEPVTAAAVLVETVTGLAAVPSLTDVRLHGRHVTDEWARTILASPAAARWDRFEARGEGMTAGITWPRAEET